MRWHNLSLLSSQNLTLISFLKWTFHINQLQLFIAPTSDHYYQLPKIIKCSYNQKFTTKLPWLSLEFGDRKKCIRIHSVQWFADKYLTTGCSEKKVLIYSISQFSEILSPRPISGWRHKPACKIPKHLIIGSYKLVQMNSSTPLPECLFFFFFFASLKRELSWFALVFRIFGSWCCVMFLR